jgi:hypothetical protein
MNTPKTNLQPIQEKINQKREEIYKTINMLILSDNVFENTNLTYDDKKQTFTIDFSFVKSTDEGLLIIDLDDVRRSLKFPYEFLEDVEIILGNMQMLSARWIRGLKVRCLDYCHIFVGEECNVSAGNDNSISIGSESTLECKHSNIIKTGILCNLKIGNNNNVEYLDTETSLIGGEHNKVNLVLIENNMDELENYKQVEIKLGRGSEITTVCHNIIIE